MDDARNAYVLRIAPGRNDKVDQSLDRNEIVIGWGEAEGLLTPDLPWIAFRNIVHEAYYSDRANLRPAGNAAGALWRFIRDMKPGDLVVVPRPGEFYVAEITGDAKHGGTDDTHFRRTVRWLNSGQPIPRKLARAALQSRMKIQGTCADASDLLASIEECIELVPRGEVPTFHGELRDNLIKAAILEIRQGRMDSYGFETLIQEVMLAMGAAKCTVTARSKDFGADLIATFLIAGVFEVRVAIQAKHYYQLGSGLPAGVVGEVIRGIEREGASLGMIITAGTLSDEATAAAQEYFDQTGIRIELIDGEQFAGMIVERGLGTKGFTA